MLCRPDHEWPVLIAANRDEMLDRTWSAPTPRLVLCARATM
jgi:uncharacterized protein with NRDE domain